MENIQKVGVCFHIVQNGHKSTLNYSKLIEFVKGINNVSAIWDSNEILLYDPVKLKSFITKNNISRIVIAGTQTGFLKPLFAKILAENSLNPNNIGLCDFNEYDVLSEGKTELAKILLLSAINNKPVSSLIQSKKVDVLPDTLVLGGGIAGIQASLEIANGNKKVYLVEKSGTIGGHMAMFDKTFPTLDCAACILTPKMVEVGQHPNIDLITYSEVQEVTGEPGNFTVKILKKTRRVNISTCIGCGTCNEKCPTKAPSEFDEGTTMRKAIYIPFPQAVPNKYLIDADSCTYVQKGKCGVCIKVCPVENCIDLDAKDETIEIKVGNIIVATGFQVFDAKKIERYGYGKYPNVVTSLEFERLVNAAGPTGGNIHLRGVDKKGNPVFTTDNDIPKSVALVHCVGSRDENHNKYCSRVCCMYSLKLAHLVKEKLPDAEVTEYYIDMRAFGKGYEEFYERIKKEVNIIRGRTAKIEQIGDQLLIRSENILEDKLDEKKVDMVILAVGLEPSTDTEKISQILKIPRGGDGWFKEAGSVDDTVSTYQPGIFLAGVCQGPKDIPDTVAQASAAASAVLKSISGKNIKQNINELSLHEIQLTLKQD